MSGNYAIGALGGYPSFNALDYQALAAVMNTPNPNAQVAFRGNTQSVQPAAAASTPQVQYVQAEPEKKGKRGKVVLGTILVAGAAACIYGFKKGNVDLKGFARVKDGLKTAWNSIRGKASTAASEAANAATTAAEKATAGKRTIQEIGGKTVVTLPGEKNIISSVANKANPTRSVATAATELANIGEKVNTGDVLQRFEAVTKDGVTTYKLKEGNELRSFVLEHTISKGKVGSGTYKIIGVKDGAITIVKDGKKVVSGVDVKEGVYSQLEEKAKEVFAGKVDPSTLKQAIIRNTNKETGLVATIKATGGKEELLSAVTNRFSSGSKRVRYLAAKDSNIKDALASIKDPKKRGNNLNIATADVILPADRNVTYTVDGQGNVLKVKYKEKGRDVILDAVKNEEDFVIYQSEHPKAFEAVTKSDKKKWFNRVFEF